MNTIRILAIGIALLLIQACSHPIDIEGMGDVVTTENGGTSTRGCTLEEATATPVDDKCAKNIVSGKKMHEGGWWVPADYKETYTALPRDGWKFDSWLNCVFDGLSTEDGNKCTFDVPAAKVRAAWGSTVPTLTAKFSQCGAEVCGNGQDDDCDGYVDEGCTGCPCVADYPGGLIGVISAMQVFAGQVTNIQNTSCNPSGPGPSDFFQYELSEANGGAAYFASTLDGGIASCVLSLDGFGTSRELDFGTAKACGAAFGEMKDVDPLGVCPPT